MRLFLCQHGAWRCVGRQISQHELDGVEDHLRKCRGLEQRWRVPKRAVEDPALSIALDPNQPVVPVRTYMPWAQIRFVRIDAEQHMQFLPGVRARRQEVIEL